MSTLKHRTLFITGASRGIGLAIARRAAADGANLVIAAKTERPHPVLSGTIGEAAAAVEAAGGKALAVRVDVRDDSAVAAAVAAGVDRFGGIDILVNNASAIQLTDTPSTSMRRFDRMTSVNARATFATTQACLPHLERSDNPHVLNLAPPPSLDPGWWGPHVAYTFAKMGMSFVTLGHAEEFRDRGIAVNALWPATAIATEALRMLPGVDVARCRTPAVVADAAHAILGREASKVTGRFFIDEEVLRNEGCDEFSKYAVDPTREPIRDLFLGDPREGSFGP